LSFLNAAANTLLLNAALISHFAGQYIFASIICKLASGNPVIRFGSSFLKRFLCELCFFSLCLMPFPGLGGGRIGVLCRRDRSEFRDRDQRIREDGAGGGGGGGRGETVRSGSVGAIDKGTLPPCVGAFTFSASGCDLYSIYVPCSRSSVCLAGCPYFLTFSALS
jgi:hypothetical protein